MKTNQAWVVTLALLFKLVLIYLYLPIAAPFLVFYMYGFGIWIAKRYNHFENYLELTATAKSPT